MAALKSFSGISTICVTVTSADSPFSFRDLLDSWYETFLILGKMSDFFIETWTVWVLGDHILFKPVF